MIIQILPRLVMIAVVLPSTGCTGSTPGAPNTSPGTSVSSPARADLAADPCTFNVLVTNADVSLSRDDSCYFETHTPIEFFNDLRMHPHQPVMVMDVPDGWITLQDAELLVQEIDSAGSSMTLGGPVSVFYRF